MASNVEERFDERPRTPKPRSGGWPPHWWLAMPLDPRVTLLVSVLAVLVLGASQPAASHGEGGIPAQLDLMRHEAIQHEQATVLAHDGLALDHDGLAVDHDVQDVAHAQTAARLLAIETRLIQVESRLASVEARLSALEARLAFLDVSAETAAGAVEGTTVEALSLVRVTHAGEDLSGLAIEDFAIATRIVPAGECSLEIDAIEAFANGDYVLHLTPVDTAASCDWGAGDYVASLTVTGSLGEGSVLVRVSVPSGAQSEAQTALQSSTPFPEL